MTTPALFDRHRAWALSLVGPERWDRAAWKEDRLTALVVLWKACREWGGGPGFREYAEPLIREAVGRERTG